MRSFTISENDSGQRLDKFLSKALPNLPKSLMYKYIRKKRIKLNSKRCEANTMLCLGDTIQLYISEEFFAQSFREEKTQMPKISCDIDIIYEDENIALIYKKPMLICHSSNKSEHDTLVNRFVSYLTAKGEYNAFAENSFRPALCNRLDKNTCGIVIGAKNAAALREINSAIADRRIYKKYLCICVGALPEKHDIIKGYLRKDCNENKVFISDKPLANSKEIITEYTLLERNESLQLVEILLHTGRSHQIRAHMAHIGAPVLGDAKYGNLNANKRFKAPYQALCAYKISFDFADSSRLAYLNNMDFQASDIWFLNRYFK